MKKTIFTLMLFVSACSNISQVGILGNVNNSERNKACMDMTQFKVLQVVEDGHALAFECNDGDYCYNNTVVLLTPQKGIDYYDDMIVGLPDEKCAIQDGVYRYETKNKSIKTVPVIRYDYEYASKDDTEKDKRFHETMNDLRDGCKAYMAQDKKTNNEKSMKKCDCIIDGIVTEYNEINTKEVTDAEADKIINNMQSKIEKKCGKIPDYLK